MSKVTMEGYDEGEILLLAGYPFYMKQPTERMSKLFDKYETILRQVLGSEVVGVYSMGSGAIPGMVGSPMIDILLAMRNAPPTEVQLSKLKEIGVGLIGDGKSPHDPSDTWFQNLDFPTEGNFEEFKVNGAHPPDGYLGRLIVHFCPYQSQFVHNSLCYVEYLKQNQDAFNRYRDVKIEGARMQCDGNEIKADQSGMSAFRKYKMHKTKVVKELIEESKTWGEKEENFNLPRELME